MDPRREKLERKLVSEPFNHALRLEYANVLLNDGDSAAALTQFELLAQQLRDDARVAVGRACALLRLDRVDEAATIYSGARRLPGFVADAELDALLAARKPSQPKLALVEPAKNVVSIASAKGSQISFADIAGLEDLKRTIRLQIIEPFLRPGLFARFKKKAGGGVLLYGPPGCGKTMMARAVATECRAEFISVGISDVLNMYIGESERNLAAIFEKARSLRPCVLFFDEIDALAFSRSKAQSEHTRQVVNEFLAQLDGFGADNQEVLILAATNMPWDVDPAMKRPGRFSRQVFVPPPDALARAHIIELKLKDVPHDAIDARLLADRTQHFSGADIDGLVELAKDFVLDDHLTRNVERPLLQEDLSRAVTSVQPSTLDWLRTARNLVKYAGADDSYREVEAYLKRYKLL